MTATSSTATGGMKPQRSTFVRRAPLRIAVISYYLPSGSKIGVGYQAHEPQGKEHPNMTMNNLVASVKATGGICVVGVFVPEDPGGADKLAKQGEIAFDWGLFWF